MKIDEILVLHHSHLDVGFTHSQPILWEMQREYLDLALDFLDQTADFSGPSLPRWTCEVTEPVIRWLQTAPPEQVQRFRAFLEQDRIAISAMQYNTTPLAGAEQLIRQLYPARQLRENLGAVITTLNQHDVNGLPWPMVETMQASGIDLLIMAINLHLGGAPAPRPGIFRWQGASGAEVLVMNGNHYTMFDQILYAWDDSLERMAEGLAEYEPVLEHFGYPYNFLYLTTANSPTAWDNSPPNLVTANLIRRWNESGRTPVIRYVTPAQLLERIRAVPREQIPVVRGDWTDWWNFGCASTALETRLYQHARSALASAELLEAARFPTRRSAALQSASRRAWDAVQQYAEHTWGYFNTDPDHPQMQTQSHLKKSYAHEAHELADYLLANELEALAGSSIQTSGPAGVLLVNPSGQACAEYVPIPDSWQQPHKNLRTNRFMYELLHPSAPAPLYGPVEMPPYSWKRIPLADLLPAAPHPGLSSGEGWIESPFHRLTYHPVTGRVTGLVDKARDWQVLDVSSPYSLFEFVRETTDALIDPRREAYYNRDLIREKFNLSCWQNGWRAVRERATRPLGFKVETGPESIRLSLTFAAPGVERLAQSITLHAGSALIDLDVSFYKTDHRDPEGIYFAIPLNLPAGWECVFDTAGSPVRLDADQIPGVCRDWFTVDGYAAVHTGERGVTLFCPDAPMVQAGGFNFGAGHTAIPREANPLLLAWPLNNYWNTNFPLAQPGQMRFHYALQTHAAFDAPAAAAQSRLAQSGVLVHPVYLPTGSALRPESGRLVTCSGAGVVVEHVKLREDGRGVLVRLKNDSAAPTSAALKPAGANLTAAFRCSPLEEPLAALPSPDGVVSLALQPFEQVAVAFYPTGSEPEVRP